MTRADFAEVDLQGALSARLGWDGKSALDAIAPGSLTLPSGRQVPLDYALDAPAISVRLQDVLGLNEHPKVGPAHRPVVIELLSPAQRPIQRTSDLPNFWTSSYADVRKDMRGRYPKHNWPEDPTTSVPPRKHRS